MKWYIEDGDEPQELGLHEGEDELIREDDNHVIEHEHEVIRDRVEDNHDDDRITRNHGSLRMEVIPTGVRDMAMG